MQKQRPDPRAFSSGCDLDERGRAALGPTLGIGWETALACSDSVPPVASIEADIVSKSGLTAA